MTGYRETIGLGLNFEIAVHDLFSDEPAFVSVLGPKTQEEKQSEVKNGEITPDLLFEIDEKQFWVDCIFRSSLRNNDVMELYWDDEYEQRMDGYNLTDPLFVAIGIGGLPTSPEIFIYNHCGRMNLKRMYKRRYDGLIKPFDSKYLLDITQEYFKSKPNIDFVNE